LVGSVVDAVAVGVQEYELGNRVPWAKKEQWENE
jgi:hypothetical protein